MTDSKIAVNWWFVLGPIVGLALVIWFFLGRNPKSAETPIDEGFDIAKLPEDEQSQATETYISDFEKQRDAWKKSGGPGLSGFTPEGEIKYQTEPGQTPSATQGEKDSGKDQDKELEVERAFLQKYRNLMDSERLQINSLSRKYYKQHKIVQEVNKYFDREHMPRYMAVHDKLRKDRNVYQFARDALSLPEVRTGIKKYIMNPQSMKVGLMLLADLLATKPPQPLYDETFRFLAADEKVSRYMGSEFWPTVTPRLPTALLEAPIPESAKSSISSLAGSLANAKVGAPDITGANRKP